jgi:hypothetical protein
MQGAPPLKRVLPHILSTAALRGEQGSQCRFRLRKNYFISALYCILQLKKLSTFFINSPAAAGQFLFLLLPYPL